MRINNTTGQISIFNQITSFKFPHETSREIIRDAIKYYKYKVGNINLIFLNDHSIKSLNKKYLKHSYATDVISFRLNDGKIVEGELYIGVETAKRNAAIFKVKFYDEIIRLIIHGSLHLIGFEDDTPEKREKMVKIENYFINLRKAESGNTVNRMTEYKIDRNLK